VGLWKVGTKTHVRMPSAWLEFHKDEERVKTTNREERKKAGRKFMLSAAGPAPDTDGFKPRV